MARLKDIRSEAEAKASVKSAQIESYDADTKPSDLSMTRLKQG